MNDKALHSFWLTLLTFTAPLCYLPRSLRPYVTCHSDLSQCLLGDADGESIKECLDQAVLKTNDTEHSIFTM